MRKDTNIMISISRRAYVRPLITAVVPAAIVLQSASPEPPSVISDPGQDGFEALSKKIEFDVWKEEEEEETPTKPFKIDWRKLSTQ